LDDVANRQGEDSPEDGTTLTFNRRGATGILRFGTVLALILGKRLLPEPVPFARPFLPSADLVGGDGS
jgi:hypothetical protein